MEWSKKIEMKILIIYGSKHGCTKDVAIEVAKQLNADVVDINNIQEGILENYDKIVFGSPIYAGMMNKKIRKFMNRQFNELRKKRLYLFLCRGDKEPDINVIIRGNIPKYEYGFQAKFVVGGEFRYSDMRFYEKLIIKILSGRKKPSIIEMKVNELVCNVKI